MSYRKARTERDKIKLMTYIQYIQQCWKENKENHNKKIVCQLHNTSAPEDGRNYRPKHVELIVIIHKIFIVASSWLFILLCLVVSGFLCCNNFILISKTGAMTNDNVDSEIYRLNAQRTVPKRTALNVFRYTSPS